ncbi:Uncharacterised protein [Mycobacteroides abscessus subsp. abscessus]|nr:Uncharacterised protein [Mycobacteroides abscessus subsp. abscessus]
MVTTAIGAARRMTATTQRYQRLCSACTACGAGRRSSLRSTGRRSQALMRAPSSISSAGSTITAAAAAASTTATPA